jgi:hypothetical protein
MKRKIGIIVTLLVIVGTAYWAFNSVRQRTYNGSSLSFNVGNGHVVVNNLSSAPIPVEMRSEGRVATFRIQSAELELSEASKRQGSGRTMYQLVSFELPPGQATIDVTRGEGVQFIATGSGRIQAVVTPMEAESARFVLGFAAVVIAIALYYLSRFTEHRWLDALRNKLPGRSQPAGKATI